MRWGASVVAVMRLIEFSINGHKPVKRRVRKIKAGGFFYDFVFSSKVESKKPAPPERFPEAEVDGHCNAAYQRRGYLAGFNRNHG